MVQSSTSFSVPAPRPRGNSSLDGLNFHALARATRKTLERLAPFALLRPTGLAQDAALLNKVVDKIKTFINGLDSSMLATQMALSLANQALRLAEPKSPEYDWSLVPRRAEEGLGKLATAAVLGDRYAQKTGATFTDVKQDLYKIAAMTKEKRSVMVIVPLDPEQPNHTVTKSLRDVGLDLNANVNLLQEFAQHASALATWWGFVRGELDVAAAAAAMITDPNTQPTSPSSPGALTLPSALNADLWLQVQTDCHSYFRNIRQVQARYPDLVAASNEAWQSSAKAISLTPSIDSGEGSEDPQQPAVSLSVPPPTKPEITPTTPTSPSTYYDARSRPLSTAVEGPEQPKPKKKRAFTLLPARASTLPRSSSTAGLSTDPKLSIKKMRAFLFTRTVPRPEVRGLFPASVKMAFSRSKSNSSGDSTQLEKGKGKGKEKDQDGNKPPHSFSNGGAPSTMTVLQEKDETFDEKRVGASSISRYEKDVDDESSLPPSLFPPPRTPSPPLSPPSPAHDDLPPQSRPATAKSLLSAPEGVIESDKAAVESKPNMEQGREGTLIDEQTAAKSRSSFALFRVAERLVRESAKRICGSCLGYGDLPS